MLARRLLLLIAVLMALTAVAAAIAPREATRGTQQRGEPTTTPSEATAPAHVPSTLREATLSERDVPSDRFVRAKVGDTVRLSIVTMSAEYVSIDDLGVLEPVESDAATEVELYADRAGQFPILLDGDKKRVLATLSVVAPRPQVREQPPG